MTVVRVIDHFPIIPLENSKAKRFWSHNMTVVRAIGHFPIIPLENSKAT